MSDYFVCFSCHQRLLVAVMDQWLDHQFHCTARPAVEPLTPTQTDFAHERSPALPDRAGMTLKSPGSPDR
jgi:hypothetical protein